MELFDAHAHVYDKRFDNDREQVLSDVFAHLKYVVCPSENLETSRKTTALVNRYPRLSVKSVWIIIISIVIKKCSRNGFTDR